MTIRITADEENNAEDWWYAARASMDAGNAPRSFLPLLEWQDEVMVSDEEAAAIRAWAQRLPGWDDGPEYARTALRFVQIDG